MKVKEPSRLLESVNDYHEYLYQAQSTELRKLWGGSLLYDVVLFGSQLYSSKPNPSKNPKNNVKLL